MMELRLAEHSVRQAVIVEVWDGDKLMAAIYPTDTGIHIHSKHFREVLADVEIPARAIQMADVNTCMVILK